MEKNYSFGFDFEFEDTDLDESLLMETEGQINKTVSQIFDSNSILQYKGEIKSEDREKFKSEFDSLCKQKERTNTCSFKNCDNKSINSEKKISRSQEIKMMLGQLAKINKNRGKTGLLTKEMTISQNSNLEPNLSNCCGSKLSPKTSYCSTKSAQYRLKCKHDFSNPKIIEEINEIQTDKRCCIFTFYNGEVDIKYEN